MRLLPFAIIMVNIHVLPGYGEPDALSMGDNHAVRQEGSTLMSRWLALGTFLLSGLLWGVREAAISYCKAGRWYRGECRDLG